MKGNAVIGIYYYKLRPEQVPGDVELPFYGMTIGNENLTVNSNDVIIPRIGEWVDVHNGTQVLSGRVYDVRYTMKDRRMDKAVSVFVREGESQWNQ